MPASSHTSSAYEQELRDLKSRLLTMGSRCEELIHQASRAFERLDVGLAKSVEATDRAINAEELAIDQMTVRILALRQPVGRDLRFLVMALKVVTDLERIADEAVNVAERVAELAAAPPVPSVNAKVQQMALAASAMVQKSLDSFVREDEQLARSVFRDDDGVDALYGEILRASMKFMSENSTRVEDGFRLASCAKYLERIADHATNIAEMVVFMVSGDDVRHPGSRATDRDAE